MTWAWASWLWVSIQCLMFIYLYLAVRYYLYRKILSIMVMVKYLNISILWFRWSSFKLSPSESRSCDSCITRILSSYLRLPSSSSAAVLAAHRALEAGAGSENNSKLGIVHIDEMSGTFWLCLPHPLDTDQCLVAAQCSDTQDFKQVNTATLT